MADRPQCQHYVRVNSKRTAPLLLCTQNASKLWLQMQDFREILVRQSLKEKKEALLTFLNGRGTFVSGAPRVPGMMESRSFTVTWCYRFFLALDSFGVAR